MDIIYFTHIKLLTEHNWENISICLLIDHNHKQMIIVRLVAEGNVAGVTFDRPVRMQPSSWDKLHLTWNDLKLENKSAAGPTNVFISQTTWFSPPKPDIISSLAERRTKKKNQNNATSARRPSLFSESLFQETFAADGLLLRDPISERSARGVGGVAERRVLLAAREWWSKSTSAVASWMVNVLRLLCFLLCVLCGSRILTVYYSPGGSNSSFICIFVSWINKGIFFKTTSICNEKTWLIKIHHLRMCSGFSLQRLSYTNIHMSVCSLSFCHFVHVFFFHPVAALKT